MVGQTWTCSTPFTVAQDMGGTRLGPVQVSFGSAGILGPVNVHSIWSARNVNCNVSVAGSSTVTSSPSGVSCPSTWLGWLYARHGCHTDGFTCHRTHLLRLVRALLRDRPLHAYNEQREKCNCKVCGNSGDPYILYRRFGQQSHPQGNGLNRFHIHSGREWHFWVFWRLLAKAEPHQRRDSRAQECGGGWGGQHLPVRLG